MLKKFIFCLPVIVLFDDKFDADRFKAAVRRPFFDTLLSKLDESTQPKKVQKEIINNLHQKIQKKHQQQGEIQDIFQESGRLKGTQQFIKTQRRNLKHPCGN